MSYYFINNLVSSYNNYKHIKQKKTKQYYKLKVFIILNKIIKNRIRIKIMKYSINIVT